MKKRVTILKNDGTIESTVNDAPDYSHLDSQLALGKFQSFIVSLDKTPKP